MDCLCRAGAGAGSRLQRSEVQRHALAVEAGSSWVGARRHSGWGMMGSLGWPSRIEAEKHSR